MDFGPQRIDPLERERISKGIAEQLKAHFGEELLAIGIYGSLGQRTDGPFSDIELHCVVESVKECRRIEWSNGDWKAGVVIDSVSGILRKAAEVRWNWPVTHGAYAFVHPIYDPTNLFIHLKKTAISQQEGKFRQAIQGLIVEEMFELIGKIRNVQESANFAALAWFCGQLTFQGACLVGLENRFLYPTTAEVYGKSLELDYLPAGYTELCRLVMEGDFSLRPAAVAACEGFWTGVNGWAKERSINLREDLENLL